MKLAEALTERAELARVIPQLMSRAATSARYQEGDIPAEDATALLNEALAAAETLEKLISRINATNSATRVSFQGDALTLTDMIARRDRLGQQHKLVTSLAEDAAGGRFSYMARRTRSEIRDVTNVDVADLRRQADLLAGQRRQTDSAIQQANWNTDLI